MASEYKTGFFLFCSNLGKWKVIIELIWYGDSLFGIVRYINHILKPDIQDGGRE